ncbi:MAG: glutathione S-transferase N-terminal domain-containing protein [Coriobacteriia bacterium]|nr:glutathione S-transferase N-terminal domain-containing protein [Coriobacteriia bacterium]
MSQDLKLYYKPTCPFSQKVLRYLEDSGVQLELRNTLEGNNQQELIEAGGKKQVPCLLINGEALYESDDIIKYLKEYHA